MIRTVAAVLLLAIALGGCAGPEATASGAPQAPPEAAGQEGGSADASGRSIAETVCARCHAIDRQAVGPHPAAPAFPVLARRLPAAALMPLLEEGIRAAHPDMPEIRLAPREIDPFLAYWATL